MVSMGGDGAVFITADEVVHTTPFAITQQSTVGAGDSMVAALVHGLAMQKPLVELAQWATAAGTKKDCIRPKAMQSLLRCD